MKSNVLFAVAPLALVVVMTACGGDKKPEEGKPDPATQTPAATPSAEQDREQPPPPPPTPPAAPDAPKRPTEEPSASPVGEPPTIVPRVPKPDAAAPGQAKPALKEEAKPAPEPPRPAPREDPTPAPAEPPKPAPQQETKSVMAKDVTVLTGSPMGGVRLEHKAHAQRAGNCTSCHHPSKPQKPASRPQQACSDCHTKAAAAPMKTKYQGAFHNPSAQSGTCIDCHKAENAKGKKAPVKCAECHKKENT